MFATIHVITESQPLIDILLQCEKLNEILKSSVQLILHVCNTNTCTCTCTISFGNMVLLLFRQYAWYSTICYARRLTACTTYFVVFLYQLTE